MRRLALLLSGLALLALGALLLCAEGPAASPRGVERAAREEASSGPRLLGARPDARHESVTPGARTVSISGRVVGSRGRPVGGARVTYAPKGGDAQDAGLTDPDGAFSIHTTLERVRIDVVAPGGRQGLRHGIAPGAHGLVIRLHDVGLLRGIVRTDVDGKPAAGVRVRAMGGGFGSVETWTSADGRFLLSAVPKGVRFSVAAEAGARGEQFLRDICWGPVGELEIRLPLVRTLRGRIVRVKGDGERVGVPGVRLQSHALECTYYGGISGHPWSRQGDGVVTGADGSFVYEGLSRSGILCVESDAWELTPEYRTYRRGFDWRFEDAPLEVVVRTPKAKGREPPASPGPPEPTEPSPFVTGVVLDEEARPVCGVEVDLIWWEAPRDRRRLRIVSGLTDAAGRFRIADLAEALCEVRTRASGFASVRLPEVRPLLAGTEIPPIRLPRLVPLCVRVVDPDGEPIPTASCRVRYGDPIPVDPSGRLEVEVPPTGELRVVVEAPGYVRRTVKREAGPLEEELTIVLEEAPAIEGRVLDVHGHPVCPARIGAMGRAYIHTWDGASTDPDGRFRLEVAEAGAYRLDVEAGDLLFPEPTVETGTSDVVVRAVEKCRIRGRVVDPSGRGLHLLRVVARLEGTDWEEDDYTDEDGYFCLEDLVGGTYGLSVPRNDKDLMRYGLVVLPRAGVRAWANDVVLEAVRGKTIAGTVTWPDGTPAVEADVRATHLGPGGDGDRASTDAAGGFQIDRLLPGSYSIHAWAWVEVDTPSTGEDDDEAEETYHESARWMVEAGEEDCRLRLVEVPEDED